MDSRTSAQISEIKTHLSRLVQSDNYGRIAERYGVNKWHINQFLKNPDYVPSARVLKAFGYEPVVEEEIYLPKTTKVLTCECGIKFYRTSNAQKKCRKDCKG